MSLYNPESEIVKFNKSNDSLQISKEFENVLLASKYFNEITKGAFDMSNRYMAGDWRQYSFDIQDRTINSASINLGWENDDTNFSAFMIDHVSCAHNPVHNDPILMIMDYIAVCIALPVFIYFPIVRKQPRRYTNHTRTGLLLTKGLLFFDVKQQLKLGTSPQVSAGSPQVACILR